MKWWVWLLLFLPAGAGVVVYSLAAGGLISDPILYLRGELSAVVIRIGMLISFLALAAAVWRVRVSRSNHLGIDRVRQEGTQERRRFLSRLDHELKNPLTAIRAGLTNLSSQALQEYQQEEVEAIQGQVLRISHLIADLRKLSALETATLERTPIDVGELLREVVGVVEDQTDAETHTISLSLPQAPWPLPEISGDPDLLLLAVHNLLDNAVKFTDEGDTIEIRAFEDGSQVVIEIADTGPGIPEQETARVWEELYRGEQARSVPGSGLGLSLVRAIIEKHGGKVGLRSKADQGSVFSIQLPSD